MAEEKPTCKILVMASGSGSNFQALVDGLADGKIQNGRIERLIVNRSKAYVTTRADKAGIPWEYFNMVTHGFVAKGEKDQEKLQAGREKYDAALAQKILGNSTTTTTIKPDLIVLAGWMHIFTKAFLDPLDAAGIKVINLHPALPGQYDGTHAIERAFDDFQKSGKKEGHTGIMMHYVIDVVDRGTPIATVEIPIKKGMTLEQLEENIHKEEHALIVKTTNKVVQDIISEKSTKATTS